MIAYRLATPDDIPFVVSSWVESYRDSHSAGMISMDRWEDVMVPEVQRVLSRPGVSIHVAYHPGETDARSDIYGWLAVERDFEVPEKVQIRGRWERRLVKSEAPLLHYLYVKNVYRLSGVARGLFKTAGIDPSKRFYFTCRTGVVKKLEGKVPQAEWSPLIARFSK